MSRGHRNVDRKGRMDLSFSGGDEQGETRAYEPFVPGPNPRLPEFIAKHATPYDPKTDTYDVPAFDRDLVVDKAAPPKAIYDMHTYWSKKHWAAIREYIRHYLPEKYYPRGTGLVLDCFSGSGMTGVAAMMEDRPCVLIDASPAAAFISHCYTHPVDPDELSAAYDRMMTEEYPAELRARLRAITGREIKNLSEELDWLYETRCDRCGGPATTEYVVYSERFQCPACAEVVALFDCPEVKVPYIVGGKKANKTELKKKRVCPHCLARRGEPHRDFVVSTRGRKFGAVPVLVRYRCLGKCRPAADERRHDEDARTKKGRFFREYDLAKMEQIEKTEIPHWHAEMKFPRNFRRWHTDLRLHGVESVDQLYTRRNLWALGAFDAAARGLGPTHAEQLQFLLTSNTFSGTRMQQAHEKGGGFQRGTYYIPQINKERNQRQCVGRKWADLRECSQALRDRAQAPVCVSCQPAGEAVPLGLDFIFIDPAYVDKVQYGELNFLWESWLGFDGTWLKDEIVVNPFRGKTVDDWDHDMRAVLAKLYTALKPGRWMSLCYHDTNPGTWTRLQNMLLDTGFEIHTVTVLDPKQKSSNQFTAEKVVKSDLVVNCRKPRPGERGENGNGEVVLVSQRVRDILIETLSNSGGQTRDRLWDVVLKRLLARGQMAEHRFDDILSEVAFRSESGRWFLKEEFESLSESDLKNEEQAGDALVRFARLRMAGVPAAFAAEIVLRTPHLADDPIDERNVEKYIRETFIKDKKEGDRFALGGRLTGVEFYDCLFFYLTRWLKGRAAGKTPRRNLAEFLGEYLVRFKEGDKWLHRAPDDAEAQSLRKARQTGLGRRIRQYVAFLRGEGEYPRERMPDAKTLVAWLKHCRAFGLAEEGVVLFEKSGLIGQLQQLSEDERYDAEEYYADCRRKAGKSKAEEETDDDEAVEDEGGDDE